jgi:RHS repeat-associated protein
MKIINKIQTLAGITDTEGIVKRCNNYDPWGASRDSTLSYLLGANEPAFDLIPRGYIGQEHLTGFNLINLNARIYDPLLGVFLSPDNYISDPTNVDSYNRYGYCNNNPVMFTETNPNS